MLIEYIDKAMSEAVYDKLEDGSFCGKIAKCPGVIAFASTLYQCERELRSSLEGWLIVKIRYGDRLPVIGKINLNNKPQNCVNPRNPRVEVAVDTVFENQLSHQ